MSRFGIRDPFYDAMNRAMAEDRMRRVLALDVRYGNCAESKQPDDDRATAPQEPQWRPFEPCLENAEQGEVE